MGPLSVPHFNHSEHAFMLRIHVLWRILRNVRNEFEEVEEKTKKIKRNFVRSYLGNGWSDFLQI